MEMHTRGMFEGIGLAPEEEDLYLRLLATGATSVRDLTRDLQWGSPRVRSVLKGLESKGFVTRSPSPTKAYVPVAPDAAVEHLALRREEEIARARSIASQLAVDFRVKLQRTDPAELVEVLVGAEATTQRVLQLMTTARTEVADISKPPYLASLETYDPIEEDLLRRGVRIRVLYESAGLELQNVTQIQRALDAGEEGRVLGELPMKLLIVDDKVALTPVASLDESKEPASLVLHAASIVNGLKLLFELLWERAVPIGVVPEDDSATQQISLDDTERELLQLVAAGFKDDVIARQMNLDPRTVRRRLRRLMDALGAETRFQAGMQVVRRGLIE